MKVDYKLLSKQIRELAEASENYIPLLSNASALLYEAMQDINWAGFYLVREGSLILGPFQGKVACVKIEKGRGVCGTAWERDEVQLVPNVHEFPGHIACDAASNSEIVIPIHEKSEKDESGASVVGVLDIDSPSFDRFSQEDKVGLEEFVKTLESIIEW